jgi:hypothetical protein
MKYSSLQKVVLTTMALVASLALSVQADRKPTVTSENQSRASMLLPAPPKPQFPQEILWDAYNFASSIATSSSTFTDMIEFSADLADSFIVPVSQTWTVESIDADGKYLNGTGPATDWNVFIYANSEAFLPGALVYSTINQPVSVVGTTFTVNLSPAPVLPAGTYWIEIQANMTFATQGEWGWTDRFVFNPPFAAWQNPGGGFGFCQSWASKIFCITGSGGPDQVFRINGTREIEFSLTSASSRMTHSREGDFDIDLPLSGVGIECRSDLSMYTVVFTFSSDIASVGSATSSCGNVGSTTISGNQVLQKFDGSTCNQSTVTVTLNDVIDTLGDTIASAPVSMGILIGDVNGDGRVKRGDVRAVQSVQGQQTNGSNFRDDVIVDGRINNMDVQTVRSHMDEVLP